MIGLVDASLTWKKVKVKGIIQISEVMMETQAMTMM